MRSKNRFIAKSARNIAKRILTDPERTTSLFHIHRLAALAGVTLLSLAAIPSIRAQSAYAISNGGDSLIHFDLATPGSLTTVGSLSGDVTRLDGIDFRPSDGLLYGYDTITNHIVTTNKSRRLPAFTRGRNGFPFQTSALRPNVV